MANRTATLYIRITTKDGKKRYCQPVYLSKGRLKPLYAMVDGKSERHPEGVYYLRFGTLSSTSYSVAQIASEVGYESEPAFNRAFKREFGNPPARYRNEARRAGSQAQQ